MKHQREIKSIPLDTRAPLHEVMLECVFFDEAGQRNQVFVKPLADYIDPARGGLPHDFIGPPARQHIEAAE